VFGGEGDGEHTNFNQMNATLMINYLLPNGSTVLPPAVYGFGSNTVEAADDLSTALLNGYPDVELGSGNFEPLGYSVQVPAFRAKINISVPAAQAGMKLPIMLNSTISNGLEPYTYIFFINGDPVYNMTTYSANYSGTVYLPPLKGGTYQLQAAVFDSIGNHAYSNSVEFSIAGQPSIDNSLYEIVIGLVVLMAVMLFAVRRRHKQNF
jgi:thermopsin